MRYIEISSEGSEDARGNFIYAVSKITFITFATKFSSILKYIFEHWGKHELF